VSVHKWSFCPISALREKIILGISNICLWLFFSSAFILEKIAILGQPPSGYVLVDATQQTDQRTSQMVYLFFAETLKSTHPELQWPDGNLLKRKGDLMDYSPEILRQIREGRAKFIAMAGTYFLGVFNDNFFKQACMLLAVASGLSGLQGRATVFFALPFILCSCLCRLACRQILKTQCCYRRKIFRAYSHDYRRNRNHNP